MVNFKKIFMQTEIWPESISYQGKAIKLGDRFPIQDHETLIIQVEKTNSKYSQGFCLGVEGSLKFGGERYKKGKYINFFLWERKEPYELQFFTKRSYVYIKNAWYEHLKSEDAPACYAGGDEWRKHDHWGGAGMIVEEIENGRRYYCNDGDLDDDFDDIIFTVTRKIDPKKS